MDFEVNKFKSGIHNVDNPENIPQDASQYSYNWITNDGKTVLVGGRKLVGAEGAMGKTKGLWYGYKVDGTKVLYRKIATKIQYLNGSTWTDIITGLTDIDVSFANYSSLAGSFTYINSNDGYWKIVNANPANAISLYDSTYNFHGKILIDKGRTLLWDRNDSGKKDPTGLYGSKIDKQDSTVYTAVTSESIGALGSATYTGTLAFKAGGATRSCFGVSIVATVTAGTETFTDDFLGNLTSNYGGTGTINYATGSYSVTFSANTTGPVTANYQWEDSNLGGVSDFRMSSPRQAGEGFIFRQDEGGDAILNVLISQDGAYYSLKKHSAYRLELTATDTNATNLVYRRDIGVPFWRAAVSTSKGIIFLNTSNETNPELTILRRNELGDAIEPYKFASQFDLKKYTYDECCIDTYDKYVMVFCKSENANNNDTILMVDLTGGSVSVVKYDGQVMAQDNGNLYLGSAITQSVYQVFTGYDDDGLTIDNEWTGKDETYKSNNLKKFKKLRLKGNIDYNQYFEVYIDYDKSGKQLVGTVRGDQSYVDYTGARAIGTNMIGAQQIGGDQGSESYPYFCELKLKCPKFRKRAITIQAKGIGYVDFETLIDYKISKFENRLPKRYRQKQNVSLDGVSTNN